VALNDCISCVDVLLRSFLSRLSSSGVPSCDFYCNLCSACAVTVVIFRHLNRSLLPVFVETDKTEAVVLDVGPTTVLSADVSRAKINVRPRNKRAPTAAHLRLREQQAAELDDNDIIRYQAGDSNAIESAAKADTVADLTEEVSKLLLLIFRQHLKAFLFHFPMYSSALFSCGPSNNSCYLGHSKYPDDDDDDH